MKNSLSFQKVSLSSVIAFSSLFLVTTAAHAQITLPGGDTVDFAGNFATFDTPGGTISTLVNVILAVSAIAAFLYILWGAFKYVTAGDDSSKTEAARKTITNAIIGLILVSLTFVIWTIVVNITGINLNFNSSTGTGGGGT